MHKHLDPERPERRGALLHTLLLRHASPSLPLAAVVIAGPVAIRDGLAAASAMTVDLN